MDEGVDEHFERARLLREEPRRWLEAELGDADVRRLATAVRAGVPIRSLAVMARWWQVESYLRLLLYITLKGAHGPTSSDDLGKATASRQRGARVSAGCIGLPELRPAFDLGDPRNEGEDLAEPPSHRIRDPRVGEAARGSSLASSIRGLQWTRCRATTRVGRRARELRVAHPHPDSSARAHVASGRRRGAVANG